MRRNFHHKHINQPFIPPPPYQTEIHAKISQIANPSTFQLEVKAANLKNPPDITYNLYKAESLGSVVCLNNRPNAKNYPMQSRTTLEEFKRVYRNCVSLYEKERLEEEKLEKQKQKEEEEKKKNEVEGAQVVRNEKKQIKELTPNPEEIWELSLKSEDQKFIYTKGKEGLVLMFKDRMIKRQMNFIVDQKEFRVDLKELIPIITQAEDKLIENIDYLEHFIDIMRFKKEQCVHINKFIKFSIAEVLETSDPEDFKNLRSALRSKGLVEMDKFVENGVHGYVMGKRERRFQIEMIFTEKGNEELSRMDENQVKGYIDQALLNFKKIITTDLTTQSLQHMMESLKI